MGFRPLTGTLLSKSKGKFVLDKDGKSFRPLTGTLLSKTEQIFARALKMVSVPSRGLSYLKEDKECMHPQKGKGFRPLTGTLLSKTHPPILPPQAAFTAGLRGK